MLEPGQCLVTTKQRLCAFACELGRSFIVGLIDYKPLGVFVALDLL